MSIGFFRKHMKTFLWPIALVIIVSFGVTFTMGEVIRRMFSNVGKIYGTRVSLEDFDAVRSNLALVRQLQGAQGEASQDEIWDYYIETTEMDRLGLALPAREIDASRRRHWASLMHAQAVNERWGNRAEQYWQWFYGRPQDEQNAVLSEILKQYPYNQKDYFEMLSQIYRDPRPLLRGWELNQRREKFLRLICSSAKATTAELYELYQEQFHRRKVAIARFSSKDFENAVQPSEKELRKFHEENQIKYFSVNPRIDIQYVLGRPHDFEDKIETPSEEDLKKFYEEHKEESDFRDSEAEKELKIKQDEEQRKKREEELRKKREEQKQKEEKKIIEEKQKAAEDKGAGDKEPAQEKVPPPPSEEKKEEEQPSEEKPVPEKTGGASSVDSANPMLFSILAEEPPSKPENEPENPEKAEPKPNEQPVPEKPETDKTPNAAAPDAKPAEKTEPGKAEPEAKAGDTAPAAQKKKEEIRVYRKFEDVKDEIRRRIISERTREALEKAFAEFYAAIQNETERALTEGRGVTDIGFETVKRLADYSGLSAVHTGLMDNSAATMLHGVGELTEINNLFEQGRVGEFSDIIDVETERGEKIILRLVERRDKENLEFEDVHETARSLYIIREAAEKAKTAAEEFVMCSRDNSLEVAMREKGVEVISTEFLRRRGYGGRLDAVEGRDSIPVLNHAFSVKKAGEWTGVLEREQETPLELEMERLGEYMREKRYFVIKCIEMELPKSEEFAKEISLLQEHHVRRSRRMYFYSLWKNDATKRANFTSAKSEPDQKRISNEYEASSRLRKITDAQKKFHEQYGRYATLEELSDPNRFEGHYLEPNIGGERDGYMVKVEIHYTGYNAAAEPSKPGLNGTGNKRYSVDESGEIEIDIIDDRIEEE
ncbi:MAG: hypothetical protein ACYS8W_08570 [Planctomycetota bacterium]|jgi:hypothetical protein